MKNLLDQWKVKAEALNLDTIKADAWVLPIWKKKKQNQAFQALDQAHNQQLSTWLNSSVVEDNREKSTVITNVSSYKGKDLYVVVVGEAKKTTPDEIRDALGNAGKWLAGRGYKDVAILCEESNMDAAAIVEGFLMGSYRFFHHKSDPKTHATLKNITFYADQECKKSLKNEVPRAVAYVRANFLARDLVNEAPNILYPASFAKIAQDVAKKQANVSIKVLTKKEIEKENMNLLMAVGRASDYEPRVVHLHYKPKKKAKAKVAFVGKGVTFDTGGLSLKPPTSMVSMKTDMGGAAAVLATIQAVADLQLPVEVHGLMGLVENAVNGNATRPDDVVRGRNGKTVEIENTDAEGRLVLADVLNYAEELKVDYLIDAATLTGACVVALGTDIFAVYANDDKLSSRLLQASQEVGDKAWRMPLEESYRKQLKSEVADMRNIGGREGGSITAALFLSEFVKDTKWAHCDIAGPARATQDYPTSVKGGTGIPSRTFIRFIENL
jgi:leucyl aminopeptidase